MHQVRILYLLNFVIIKIIIFILFISSTVIADEILSKYDVSTSGIKIGSFNWLITTEDDYYETKIFLKNEGILSSLYKFEGEYLSRGKINNNQFKTQYYKQHWVTKNKTKVVEMSFSNNLINIFQEPEELEHSRIKFNELYEYFDPITSFLNILKGEKSVKTIDGRRVYIMKKTLSNKSDEMILMIEDYKNIWADHKRNDLKKIEFLMGGEKILPKKINIYFKNRVFKLKKI